MESLCALPVAALALKIRRGEVNAVDAVEAYIARQEEVNPALNALVARPWRDDMVLAVMREIESSPPTDG